MADTSRSVESIIKELERDLNNFLRAKPVGINCQDYFEAFRNSYILNSKAPWSTCINHRENGSLLRKVVYDYFDYWKELYLHRIAIPEVENRLRNATAEILKDINDVVYIRDSKNSGIINYYLSTDVNRIRDKLIEDKIHDNTLFMAEAFEKDQLFYCFLFKDIFLPLRAHKSESNEERLQALREVFINIISNHFSNISQDCKVGCNLSISETRATILAKIKNEIEELRDSIYSLPGNTSATKTFLQRCVEKIEARSNTNYGFIEWKVAFNTPLKTEPQKPFFSQEVLNTPIALENMAASSSTSSRTSSSRSQLSASSPSSASVNRSQQQNTMRPLVSSSSNSGVTKTLQNGSRSNNAGSSNTSSSSNGYPQPTQPQVRVTSNAQQSFSDLDVKLAAFEEREKLKWEERESHRMELREQAMLLASGYPQPTHPQGRDAEISSDSDYHMSQDEKDAQRGLWEVHEAKKQAELLAAKALSISAEEEAAQAQLWDAAKAQQAVQVSSFSSRQNPSGFFSNNGSSLIAMSTPTSSSSSSPVDTTANPSEESAKQQFLWRTAAMGYSYALLDYLEKGFKPGEKYFKQIFDEEKIEDPDDSLCSNLSLEVPNIPVKLYEQIYDLSELEGLPVDEFGTRKVPHNEYRFHLAEIAPAREVKRELDKTIAEHNSKKSTVSSPAENNPENYAPSAPSYEESIADSEQETPERSSSLVSSSFPGYAAHPAGGETSSHGNGYPAPDLIGQRKTFGR